MRKFYSIKKAGVMAVAIVLGFSSLVPSMAAPTDSDQTSMQQTAKTVKVLVNDVDGQPIIGAIVSLKGTNKAVATAADGSASIQAEPGSVLTVSYMGYKAYELTVAGANNYTVNMVEDAISLDQVVVVGYGTQKKANLTGAVSQVQMDKILGDRPVTSIGAALQGAIPGLQITGSAKPGEAMSFNIRGTATLNSDGAPQNSAPLILVDNVPADVSMINPEDIETVSVLKDASSAAIYGARGAFGVVLITTKKAKKNTRLSINYNDNFAFQTAINRPQQASVEQILQAHLDFDNDGKYFADGQILKDWVGYVQDYNAGTLMQKYPDAYLKDGRFIPKGTSSYYYLSDNDPQGEVLDKYGFQQTHNISATGGSENITYRMSLGYTDSDGPIITSKDSYQRINVSSYVNADITKWLSTSLDVRYAKSKRSYVESDGNLFNTYFRRFYPTGSIPKSSDLDGPEYLTGTPANYMMNVEPTIWEDENPRIYSRTSIRPVKGLEAIFEYTYDQTNSDRKKYNNGFNVINDQMGVIAVNPTPLYRNDKTTVRYNSLNAFATYDISTKNEKHNFKIMAGYSQEQRYSEALWAERIELINPSMPSISGAVGETKAGDTFNDYTIRSGFFRFNYDFMGKYLVEINGRYDGSSKFPTSNRYGFFPSGSLGWQLAKENFMDWSDSWLDEFKIRASWGQVGNQNIGNYLYTPAMSSSLADWIVGGAKPTTLGMPALVRTNFTWEVVETLDIGLDLALFNNRLSATFDWYQRDTKGMLAPGMDLPAVVGASAPMQNSADLRTSGWELAMQWRDKVGNWGYSVGFNIYDSRTKIINYRNDSYLLFNSSGTKQRYIGEDIGEIWGYETDGFYTIEDFQDGWKNDKWKLKDGVTSIRGNSNVRPGDVKFKNLRDYEGSENEISNGDNTLDNPGDQKVIGNSTPRYQYGINASVNWKGFDLSIFISGTGKRDVWIGGDMMFPLSYGTFGTLYYNQLDYWKPVNWQVGNGDLDYTAQNPDAHYPRIYNESNNGVSNTRTQTKYLSNASYMRLKNVTLSYSVPRALMQKIGMTGAKIFFSGENLLTVSTLPKGIDPERLNWGYPFYATYSFGISLTL